MDKVVFRKLKVKSNKSYPSMYTVFALDSDGNIWKRDHDQQQWTELEAPDRRRRGIPNPHPSNAPDAEY
jgi:hypothetical protein